jgi:hypothetical protein
MGRVFEGMVLEAPHPQSTIDLFAGDWAYELPIAGVRSGKGRGFLEKHHSVWLCEKVFGRLKGMTCLELGPNEGEVSFHLHHAGCREVLAIEARVLSFLKCLVVKNYLKLDSVQFALGDFVKYMEETDHQFDLCLAAGVLYHMPDPVHVIELMTRRATRIALATHYFHDKLLQYDAAADTTGLPSATWQFPEPEGTIHAHGSLAVRYYRYVYPDRQEDHETYGHGGTAMFANLMTLEDISKTVEYFGFKILELTDTVDCERGPFATLVAKRR